MYFLQERGEAAAQDRNVLDVPEDPCSEFDDVNCRKKSLGNALGTAIAA
jgi:hypothetical protein